MVVAASPPVLLGPFVGVLVDRHSHQIYLACGAALLVTAAVAARTRPLRQFLAGGSG